ncbi:MAG: PAS domain S-box protein [Anaerolineaceae bacterium]|nr:PAS domain S-box protein [Anaerolineaceae bacterium]
MTGSTVPQELPSNLRRKFLIAGVGYLLLYASWLVWGRQEPFERLWVGNLALIFTSLVAGTAAFRAQSKLEPGRLRAAWRWLTAGLGFWAAGDILNLIPLFANFGKVFRFSFADFVILGGYLSFWVGLTVYPRRPRPHFGRLPILFDTTIVTASVLTLVWIAAFQPLVPLLPSLPNGELIPLVYPVVDLVSLLLLTALFLLSDSTRLPIPLGWAGLGLAAFAFSDLALVSQLLNGSYTAGSPIDLGWACGDLLLVFASISQLVAQNSTRPGRASLLLSFRSMQRLLPLLTVLALGGYTLFLWQFYGQFNQPGLWVTLVLALGLVARQGMLAGESELQKYASLVNSIAEPAFVCDAHGRLRLVNPALLAAAGYSNAQDLLGQPVQQILHPAAGVAQILAEALLQGWSGEIHLRRRGGSLIPISLALRPLQSERDSRLTLAGTAHDLSKQKRQQASLQAAYEQIALDRAELETLNTRLEHRVAEKTADLVLALQQLEEQNLALQQLDRLKSDFVSLVSHELRAPLTNISGGIELLLSASQSVGDRPRHNLELVQAEIQRLSHFVESILDLSALDAGHLPLYPAPVSLQGVVQNLKKGGGADSQRFRWEIPEDLPPIMADEQALSSILFHLLDNACKYAPEGEILISARPASGRLQIDVADCGPGIPEEALPLIFERFYRQDSADARAVYGHGLGLYIVSRLLSAMQGEIQAANRAVGGACFSFWLPCADNKGREDEPQSASD